MIFTITMCSSLLKKTNRDGKPYHTREYRAVGYYLEQEKAQAAILENRGDIQEKQYEYAVLEAIPEGVYPVGDEGYEQWFKWNAKDCRFEPSEKPAELAQTYGFAMG